MCDHLRRFRFNVRIGLVEMEGERIGGGWGGDDVLTTLNGNLNMPYSSQVSLPFSSCFFLLFSRVSFPPSQVTLIRGYVIQFYFVF